MTPEEQKRLTPEQLAEMPTLHDAPPVGPGAASLPGSIGPFRVVEELGRGGMGVVYRAEQSHPRRVVALKVMRPGLVSDAASARFRREAQVLALLRHPGIGQIYQAGSAPIDGRGEPVSFFAMELIEGDTLTAYASKRELSTRERLALLAEVAHAVHHAHTKGVIHRDLKPSNVLVDEHDRVKVLDFGIARLADADSPVATLSETGQLIGTLAYMSPEQVTGAIADLDTRSDVFALGVIGYELLSGRLPHALEGRSVVESVRTIAEGEIKPLSSIDVRLRGDAATIIGKALEKDRDRRYQSADEFAQDIERFLRDEPIMARPPSLVYSLGKFARRHKPFVAGLSVAVLTLVVMSAVASRQALVATQQRTAAETEAKITGQISGFMRRMLSSADPTIAQGQELTVREVVDQAAAEVDDAALMPIVGAEIRYTLGQTYTTLGVYDSAEAMLNRAVELYEQADGPDARSTLNARRQLANVYAEMGQPDKAEAIASDVLAKLEPRFGPDDADVLAARAELARSWLDQGEVEEAIGELQAVIDAAQKSLPTDSDVTLTAMHNLASTLSQAGKLRESVDLNKKVLEIRRKKLGDRHPDTITTMNNLATTLVRLGETDRAEEMLREVLRLRREVLGNEHRATATAILNLTGILIPEGRRDEAEPLLREALKICTDNLGPEHPVTLSARNQLAYLLEDQGKLEEAETLYRETIDVLGRTAGRDHPEMLAPINNLASLLVHEGKAGEAEPIYRDLLDRTVSIVGPEHFFTGIFRSNYGECLTKLGRRDDAIAALTEAIRVLEAALGPDHERVKTAKARLEAAEALPG
ncbi:MAG: tetratricopeptide repeat protein [Phycisphaeraceae bacterium]|nr:MAG: tetratricopeptide repeat protein [Phycisphaeraceae bacterium]